MFNWLYARHTGGKFLLRIEDTDKQRSTEEHTRVILDGLTWLGLDWDEDLVFQGARLERHQEVADNLLAEGKAYMDEGAIRFRLPPGEIAWDDAVHGQISFQGEDIKDFIILRSDRTPIYNLAVVVDDIDMAITHVLRGDDHISNTPKQIALYHAIGARLPVFGHVPMIHGPDGKKLSKRHGATALGDYQHMGLLPAAMRNFLALLGWSPGGDREIMTLDEMVQRFSFEGIQKKSAIFDIVKLTWMNSQYISNTSVDELLRIIRPQLEARGVLSVVNDENRVHQVIDFVKARSHNTNELLFLVASRLDRKSWGFDDKAREEIKKNEGKFVIAWQAAKEELQKLPPTQWEPNVLESHLRQAAERHGFTTQQFFQPIRIAISGSTVSEPVNQLLSGVGHQEAVSRLEEVIHSWPSVPSTSAQIGPVLFPPKGGNTP